MMINIFFCCFLDRIAHARMYVRMRVSVREVLSLRMLFEYMTVHTCVRQCVCLCS